MPNESQADHLKRWDLALAAAEANAKEPGIDDLRLELGEASAGVKDTLARQASLKFQLQDATRALEDFMARGRKAFSRLRLVVKGRYGRESEKLAEYGMQPFRAAPRPSESKSKEKPPVKGQSPTQAANSPTESST